MGMFSGIMKSLVNPMSLMQLAMGPAGWASLAMKTIGSQIAMQLIQKLGQELGLPPAVINLAQGAFAQASGQPGLAQQSIGEAVRGFTQQMNLRPSEAGQLERDLLGAARNTESGMDTIMSNLMNIVKAEGKKSEKRNEFEGLSTSKGKKNFLMAMAEALGGAIDKQMDRMLKLSGDIEKQTKINEDFTSRMSDKDSQKQGSQVTNNSQKMGSLQTELGAVSQQMSILSNAATNAIKSIGEAQTTLARKG